ncbi:rRNA maturation RNase YbeY [Anianabacter salinae]|uniref:rRNA maturation RNase YbeY n=1 Tax=Anianabacter salinae TaxID=2851023 RepID=UPI00225DF1F9|nr:rRNA maturation RNase YbeY [Anianabacter salinae]MBV0912725.1 rRNA maturation RNase YbeY [Anianabacter salinae]
MTVDTIIEDPRWTAHGIDAVAGTAAQAALRHLGLDPAAWEISLLACDDQRIAQLNGSFRGKAQPTNVLSWPSEDRAPDTPGAAPASPGAGGDTELGDIAIAFETCAREAAQAGKPIADHVTHLIVHGTLHLLGYDHETDADAALMEGLEVEILARLGVANPYSDHAGTAN